MLNWLETITHSFRILPVLLTSRIINLVSTIILKVLSSRTMKVDSKEMTTPNSVKIAIQPSSKIKTQPSLRIPSLVSSETLNQTLLTTTMQHTLITQIVRLSTMIVNQPKKKD